MERLVFHNFKKISGKLNRKQTKTGNRDGSENIEIFQYFRAIPGGMGGLILVVTLIETQ